MKINLNDRIVLITGASGELGRAIAKTCAACGADIGIHYHQNKDAAVKLMNDINALGKKAAVFQADVTSADGINAMKDQVCADLGHPHIIVNNAVIQYAPWTSVVEQNAGDYESQFNSCVMHNVYMAKAFVPEMIKNRYGRVIAINTECSMQMLAGQSAYVAAKRGMDGMLRVLAREAGQYGITVNQVAPGWTLSEKHGNALPEGADTYAATVPMRRLGTDQDVANAVAFLASDLASFITGAYIPVCGGNVMPCI